MCVFMQWAFRNAAVRFSFGAASMPFTASCWEALTIGSPKSETVLKAAIYLSIMRVAVGEKMFDRRPLRLIEEGEDDLLKA